MTTDEAFRDLRVDHIEFSVGDVEAAADQFRDGYGMRIYAERTTIAQGRSLALETGSIRLVLTEAAGEQPAASYVIQHGDGVSDIALATPDVEAAFAAAIERGARVVAPPKRVDGIVTASIMGFGDVRHKLVERRPGDDHRSLPGFTVFDDPAPVPEVDLRAVDHFAVCLEAGQLRSWVEFYEHVLGFRKVFTERIVVGEQAMDSIVVQSSSGAVTFTMIEPDISLAPGQIDTFLKSHGGPGVQHIAFAVDDITDAVRRLGARGVVFLTTPLAYYDQLPSRLTPSRHRVEQLRRLNILVDEDHDGQLFQIFTRSSHPRGTIFMEIIERRGARTFGSGNIKALYESVEMQMVREKR